jgi:hypothetical protein
MYCQYKEIAIPLQFIFSTEIGTSIPHCTYKHGISPETVKAAFPVVMRDWNDGSHRVRLCKTSTKAIMRIAYDWLKPNQKVKIYSAYYI